MYGFKITCNTLENTFHISSIVHDPSQPYDNSYPQCLKYNQRRAQCQRDAA